MPRPQESSKRSKPLDQPIDGHEVVGAGKTASSMAQKKLSSNVIAVFVRLHGSPDVSVTSIWSQPFRPVHIGYRIKIPQAQRILESGLK